MANGTKLDSLSLQSSQPNLVIYFRNLLHLQKNYVKNKIQDLLQDLFFLEEQCAEIYLHSERLVCVNSGQQWRSAQCWLVRKIKTLFK